MDDQALIEHGISSLAIDEYDGDMRQSRVQCDVAQCLFCNHISIGLHENFEHMLKRHGLFIPDIDHLIVDLETFIEYFHLVIYGYFECLYCGSQRGSPAAAQQHMMGKGHCKIDIMREDSEFRDFYDFESISDISASDDADAEYQPKPSEVDFIEVDNVMRLPSGKILSHRAQGGSNRHRKINSQPSGIVSNLGPTTPLGIPEPEWESIPSSSTRAASSKRLAKQEVKFNRQLSSLRIEDQRSLMHLTVSQQRTVVMKGKKQVEKAKKDENDMLLKIQLKANR